VLVPEPAWAQVALVRHGETEWSASGRHTSVTDLPLTDGGRAQAARLAPRLASWHFALVLTSPRRRAVETSQLAGTRDVAVVDSNLAEWDYGDYEGLTSAEIEERRPGWTLWRDGCPGGERPAAVAARADQVIERCRSAGGDVAIFSHGHLLRVLAARWIGRAPELGRDLALATASLSVLGAEHAHPVLASWNETG
jgi:probable phosphoglycerate mutase